MRDDVEDAIHAGTLLATQGPKSYGGYSAVVVATEFGPILLEVEHDIDYDGRDDSSVVAYAIGNDQEFTDFVYSGASARTMRAEFGLA